MAALIRLSAPEDGTAIAALMSTMGEGLPGIDWSSTAPFWLVAEEEGEIVGCIQAVSALPLGYISNLAVRKDKRMGRLKLKLLTEALRSLQAYGCQYAVGFVPFHQTKWRQALMKGGAIEGVNGTIYAMSLMEEADER